MKRVLGISFLVMSLFVLGTASSALSADVLKIGVISPVSGNYGDHGALERAGMEMALRELGGKIGGKTVELVVADSETNPDTAARRVRALIEKDGVNIFMGGVSSSVCLAVAAVVAERNKLYFATNGNSDELSSTKAVKNMFRLCPSMAVMGRVSGSFAAENLGKKWFFMTHDYSWGHSGTRWGRDIMPKVGATEVGEVKVPMGTRDFSAQLLQIRNSGADVLITTVGGFDNVALLKQLAEYRIYDKMQVIDTLQEYCDVYALQPNERQGYWATEISWDESEKIKEWNKRFHEMFPKAAAPVVDCGNYNGYVGIMALAEAIEKAGTDSDVDKLIKTLEGMEVKNNLRDEPTYIDPRTHQFWSKVVVTKADPELVWKLVKVYNARDFDMTPEENPIDLTK